MQFLLSLVNDLLDMKMMDKGVFQPKIENFSPKDTLDFVMTMF